MNKSKKSDAAKNILVMEVDPMECPFREFRDHELSIDFWGMGPAATRATMLSKTVTKPPADYVWIDDQTQPLPRSVRQYLNGWIRAEELAMSRWEAEVVIFEDTHSGKMNVMDMQLSHPQVLLRSSFCRKVLSACYILERVENLSVEHTWEGFMANFGPEGWRPRYHIYVPGMKSGGGSQHRPGLSKSGCYLVRLYHHGAWRCVWVSDQVPVDSTESPLLPFSPLLSHAPRSTKQMPVTSGVVHLWPLLICKALLKLAVPDMNSDGDIIDDMIVGEDESMEGFDILHALTGNLSLIYYVKDDELWNLLNREVAIFIWDDDDETLASTIKTKSSKKPTNKDLYSSSKRSILSMFIQDTKNAQPYILPGITPAHPMDLIVTLVRDIPLKKPLPEPEVPLWKEYRWVDWAKRHGLYDAFNFPRTKFLKVNGLMKLSYAPHLLDVQSTESITFCFREEQEKQPKGKGAQGKDTNIRSQSQFQTPSQLKEEMREWVQFDNIKPFVEHVKVLYYPSMFQYTTAASSPPIRPPTKGIPNKFLDIPAPKAAPLYLQIDSGEPNKLRLSLSSLHPRILINSGIPLDDDINSSNIILELFEWFKDVEVPTPKAYFKSWGYDSIEINFKPGRHFCRLWVNSRMHWHVALLSESNLLLGNREAVLSAAVKECPWAGKFLNQLASSFNTWFRVNRSNSNVLLADQEFYTSYQPDLEWDENIVGYSKCYLHWMFRKALQTLLTKKLPNHEYYIVCQVLRKYFQDPDFGFKEKPALMKESFGTIIATDPCDCTMPEAEEFEVEVTLLEDQITIPETTVQSYLSIETMQQLLTKPIPPATSQLCELATDSMTCPMLKMERERAILMNSAATVIQAHWRGTFARNCLRRQVNVTPDIVKLLMDYAFGNLDALTNLMNEFFTLFPGAKYAYSVSSGLCGVYGLAQHYGSAFVPNQHKWIPYFQGVFYCHEPVQVHFDLQSTLQYCSLAVYNNDTGLQMPQAYNAHITFDFIPNMFGYTVIGSGTITSNRSIPSEVQWQLTVMTSVDGVFHVCDYNDVEYCNLLPLQPASKIHLKEIFIPNRRNILGGITIAVTKVESLCFRVVSTCPGLEMVAILNTKNSEGEMEEISRCRGNGEICWPYIRLKPTAFSTLALTKRRSISHVNIKRGTIHTSTRSLKENPPLKKKSLLSTVKAKSTTRFKEVKDTKATPIDPKMYIIEVRAVNGWPLPLEQWKRVNEVRNIVELLEKEQKEPTPKAKPGKEGKDKGGAKDKKEKDVEKLPTIVVPQPNPDDAYCILECSTSVGGGAAPKRDDERDILFANTKRSWESKEPNRRIRGAQLRVLFREEFLLPLPKPVSITKTESTSVEEDMYEGDSDFNESKFQQRPSAVFEDELMEAEEEELAKYYTMPDQLRDKFIPLNFVPLCLRDKLDEDPILMTSKKAEFDREERQTTVELSLKVMNELQRHNEFNVLAKQKIRVKMLERIGVDATWSPELAQVMEERDEAIAKELSDTAARKKKELSEKAESKKK